VTESTREPLGLGDALALARRGWIRESAARLGERGFRDYRRSDAYVVRELARRSSPMGELGIVLDMTRQGARKVVDALVARGYADVSLDETDARKLVVSLSARGARYARAITEVIDELNAELRGAVSAEDFESSLRLLTIVRERFG
jgi:DNA-binding MarR family transcriptional regulator